MKKIIICLFIIIGIYFICKPQESNVIIPKDAIRFRVIANSNTKEDQKLKMNVKDSLTPEIADILKNSNSLSDTRTNIINNTPMLKNNIEHTLNSLNSNTNYSINYGMNYFPKKEYKGVSYPAGEYESLVVTLGEGNGENWWCVLFPPLCLLEAEENDTEEVEYQFLISKIIDKFSK